MNNDKAIALLRRMQEPEAYEPQITAEAFEALGMAIKALERVSFPQRHENDHFAEISKKATQPELAQNLHTTCTDTISRQAAIDEIRRCRFVVDAIEKISKLPSAQPELAQNLHTTCADTISRQAVIDALGKTSDELYENIKKGATFPQRQWFDGMAQAQSILENLPSAQPEQRWIPCSERLPKVYDNYLITTYDGNVDIGTIDPKKQGVWSACDADGFYWLREVIAWMPLPAPWRGEQE